MNNYVLNLYRIKVLFHLILKIRIKKSKGEVWGSKINLKLKKSYRIEPYYLSDSKF